jgi:hypothetical protein
MHLRQSREKTSQVPRPKIHTISGRITKKSKPILRLQNSELAAKIAQMHLTIAPIVHVETGLAPPDFPATMLSLFLLTESQLDAMAKYYNQSLPCELKFPYPQVMDWDHTVLTDNPDIPEDCRLSALERLKIKMRMFAQFIGMRGTEMPEWEYERQIEILGKRIGWEVKREEEEALRNKRYRGPNMQY